MRGGLTLAGGVLTGNLIGVLRVALTAYFLGTHSRADSLAVAMGPIDTLNAVLLNSMLFAFVPMLTARTGPERTALFFQLRSAFAWVFLAVSGSVVVAAPWLMRALAPGLNAESYGAAVNILRILALSTMAGGAASLYWALLYTERRFGPTAFYQATINLCTVVAAVSLWHAVGVYAFAIGYTAGACVQLAVVHWAARGSLEREGPLQCDIPWREILAKPAFFMVYAAGLGLNITFTRAYATHAGSGMAAAMEYCMRGVGVPLALLVNPVANSLLPEIARLKSALRLRGSFPAHRPHHGVGGPGRGGGLRFCAALPHSGDRPAVPARQLHPGIHQAGGRGLSGIGSDADRLELDRDHLAFSVRARPPLAARPRRVHSSAGERHAHAAARSFAAAIAGHRSLGGHAGRIRRLVSDGPLEPQTLAGCIIAADCEGLCQSQ